MEDSSVRLRPLRIVDGPFLIDGLRDEDVLSANSLNRHITSSWFFVWWWIKKIFNCSFCIEVKSGIIGFIGLYNMRPGRSVGITLIIFEKSLRRRGYGTGAFNLLVQNLQRHSVAKKIFVEVRRDNHIALSFWRNLGFVEVSSLDGIINMSLDLNKEARFEA
ncbi:acetyltransferase (GNAT) family protein [bacterium BMS3Abin07]|nr:acetyltransferase (GNAT) family protein [bacterium BMS3Abin07]GBE32232.1 acetyltransferase (GNAT) family protein [bacterium BMS3Bbin05]